MAPGVTVIEVDHLAYLRDRSYRRAVRAALRRLARSRAVGQLRVMHEADGSCCRIEQWSATAARIHQALEEDGERVAWLVPPMGPN